jgi:hypothetical protein
LYGLFDFRYGLPAGTILSDEDRGRAFLRDSVSQSHSSMLAESCKHGQKVDHPALWRIFQSDGATYSIRCGRPQVDRLREVRRLDTLRARQVGNGARQLQNAVVGAGAQMHPPAPALAGSAGAGVSHRRAEELPARLIHRAACPGLAARRARVVAHLGGTHLGVGRQ